MLSLVCVPNSPRWRVLCEFLLGGCAAQLFESWPNFRPQNVILPHPFSELEVVTKRNIRVYIERNYIMSSLLRLERQQKDFFLSYSLIIFIIETTNTFTQYSRSSLVNHTRFQTRMSKVDTRLHIKTAPKYALWGGIYLYSLYKGVPHPRANS